MVVRPLTDHHQRKKTAHRKFQLPTDDQRGRRVSASIEDEENVVDVQVSRLGSSLHTIHANSQSHPPIADEQDMAATMAGSPTTPRRGHAPLTFPFRQNTIARRAQTPGANELEYQLPAVAELRAADQESDSRRSSIDSDAGSSTSLPPQARLALNEQISREEEIAEGEEKEEMTKVAESPSDLSLTANPPLEEVPSDQNTAAALHEEEGEGEIVEDRMAPVAGERQRVRREKLGEKLMQVFGLQEREEVLDEMRCWLLRSVSE